jgi:hypothetical protein
MVPLRYVAEEMGARVSYDEGSGEITVRTVDTTVSLRAGDASYSDDGLAREMEAPPEASGGRTFVPAGFLAEALDRSVTWIGEDGVVIFSPRGYPWDRSRRAEAIVYGNALALMSPMLRDFAY